jgi:hypothetical protein
MSVARVLLIASLSAFVNTDIYAQDAPYPQQLRCAQLDAAGKCALYDASVIELVANPHLFDGKRVRTIGYIHFEFEGNGLYLHKEDYVRSIHANGLWVNLAQGVRSADCQDRYALVEGMFRARDRGHMGLWSGAISEITRCMPWR